MRARILVLILLIPFLILDCSDPVPGIPTGDWGGDGVSMTVSDSGATLLFNCASGTITQPLSVSAQGDGTWSGTYRRASPLPGSVPDTNHPATYHGHVQGATMTLLPSVPDLLIEFVPVTVTFGHPPNLALCP